MANRVFNKRLFDNIALMKIWEPVVQKEMSGYIGTSMFSVTLDWEAVYRKEPDDVAIEGLILCQDDKDA